jgi:tripartite-type tricarboxylate transporter receptor subunit TctC
MKRKILILMEMIALCGLILFGIPPVPFAQDFPAKPVNVLVAYSPGAAVDLSFRVLASKAEKFLGQPLIISNNGAGGSTVGVGIVAKEKPDGYHLLVAMGMGIVWFPQVRAVPYKLDDFIPIIHYGTFHAGVAARTDAPFKTLKEFVEYAKKNQGMVNYSTGGAGSPHHLAMEYIAKKEGIQWTTIPYPGGAPALTALLGGHVHACSANTSSWIPHVNAGTLRILATYGKTRMKTISDVPTLWELGYPFIYDDGFIVAAPKGVPISIVKKLDDAFRKGMEDPEFGQAMAKIDIEVAYRNSEDTKKYLDEAYVRFGKLLQEVPLPKEEEKK